jgi:hypothetical protein
LLRVHNPTLLRSLRAGAVKHEQHAAPSFASGVLAQEAARVGELAAFGSVDHGLFRFDRDH